MPFPELNDNKFEKNLTNGAHSYREKVREQILNTPRSSRSNRKSIDLTIINEATNYRPSSRRSNDTLNFEPSKLKSASRDRQVIRYNKYIPTQESKNKDSINIKEDPYFDKEFIGRPSSRESFNHFTPRLTARSARRLPVSDHDRSQIISSDNLENNLTKSINFFEFDTTKAEQPPVPKPRQKDSVLFNKQNMLFSENENLKIKRNTNSLNSSRVITPRFDHSRINRYSASIHGENGLKDESSERKLNDTLRDDRVKMRTKTNLNYSNDSLDSNQTIGKNVIRKM